MTLIEDFVATSGITYRENGIAQPSIGGNTFTRIYQDSLTISGRNEDNGIIIWDANKNITFGGTQITITDGFDNDGTLTLTSSLIIIENLVLNNGTVNLIGSTNFDSVIWDSDTAGTFAFGSDSALNITSSSNGKTLIKCTTVTGTITLDVEDGVQNGDTFLIEATNNQLIINSGEWEATPSTSGNITTYTLARVQPALPVSLKKKLHKKLALMLANLKKKRKYYTELEYLEADGTQYINTGLLSTAQSKVDVVFGFSSMESGSANNCAVFGGRNNSTTNTFTFFKIASATPQYFRFDYNSQPAAGSASDLTWSATSKYRFTYDGSTFKTDNITIGESYSVNRSPGSTFTTSPITLFAVNTNDTAGQFMSGRIYKFWYTDGTNTIDLIPVLDWNMTPCMYDKVSGQLFYNQGTGEFTYGREIHPVEYLESTGTQYIDTGYIPNINTECSMNLAFVSLDSTYRTPFSVRTADGATNSFTIMSVNSAQTNNSFAFGSSYWSGGSVPSVVLNKTIEAVLRKGYAYWDGVSGNPGTSITPTSLTAYMFARNANGTAANFFKGRIYYCQLKESNTLVRDYIPCVDESGTGYMFDRVTHTCFLNAGTGNFAYPPVEIEYLESSGTQYIDTGYNFNSNTDEIELYYQNTSTLANKWLLGSYESNANIGISSANLSQVTFWYNGNVWNAVSSQYDKKHILRYDSTGMSNDGINLKAFTSYTGTWNLYLFALNNTGTSPNGYFGYGKIWGYKHTRNGSVLLDLIPAFQNGVAGLLDKVNNVFYTNVGTGSFSVGKIVESEFE